MNPSKEECRKATATLGEIRENSSSSAAEPGNWAKVFDFLAAAERKLPSEAAYVKAAAAKRVKKKKGD